jgi:hypothetical protein
MGMSPHGIICPLSLHHKLLSCVICPQPLRCQIAEKLCQLIIKLFRPCRPLQLLICPLVLRCQLRSELL